MGYWSQTVLVQHGPSHMYIRNCIDSNQIVLALDPLPHLNNIMTLC